MEMARTKPKALEKRTSLRCQTPLEKLLQQRIRYWTPKAQVLQVQEKRLHSACSMVKAVGSSLASAEKSLRGRHAPQGE